MKNSSRPEPAIATSESAKYLATSEAGVEKPCRTFVIKALRDSRVAVSEIMEGDWYPARLSIINTPVGLRGVGTFLRVTEVWLSVWRDFSYASYVSHAI
ncbi:hypothetical protein D3C86_1184820 [compost metagenome]